MTKLSFGLNSNYSRELHKTLFFMVTYKGNWNWETLYEMPVAMRNFYVKQMVDMLEKENEVVKKSNKPVSSKKIVGKP